LVSVNTIASKAVTKHNGLGTVNLPVALYGRESWWSLTLREKRKLRVFENRVLRGIFGPKRDEITRERRKIHNEELNNLHPHSIL
jgi:hypothetical protein